eukprot:CAMPEP_0183729452 /NCGR_PEP_ID=MMETSP0737-20130205/30320_1 /TAXON_ID=385413 /ORGANISM="Thalassiosira miniscula, Strain CCMP1093" /LENGTH=530 /DNA_ID=CAMNT_0025961641 /DNA_START=325 /DNA_END=1914 /DNA_ORIENTATION=+
MKVRQDHIQRALHHSRQWQRSVPLSLMTILISLASGFDPHLTSSQSPKPLTSRNTLQTKLPAVLQSSSSINNDANNISSGQKCSASAARKFSFQSKQRYVSKLDAIASASDIVVAPKNENTNEAKESSLVNIISIKIFIGSILFSFGLMLMSLGGPLLVHPNVSSGSGSGATSGMAITSSMKNSVVTRTIQNDNGITHGNTKLKQWIGSAMKEKSMQSTASKGVFENQLDNEHLARAEMARQQILHHQELNAKLEQQPSFFNYLAAFIGSVASTLVMHPMDTIKTRMQVRGNMNGGEALNEETETEDGGNKHWMGLYEGLTGNILKEGPPSALYLGVYESTKHALLPLFHPHSILLLYLLSGAIGEMVGSIVRAPAEAIKSTVQSGMASDAFDAAHRVFGASTSRANVVKVWSASVWRDVPFGAIQLAIFEGTKSYLVAHCPEIVYGGGSGNAMLAEAMIGAFAGGCGALLTNPFDIITTRIITQSIDDKDEMCIDGDNGKDGKQERRGPLGVFEMGKKLYNDGGPGAFW